MFKFVIKFLLKTWGMPIYTCHLLLSLIRKGNPERPLIRSKTTKKKLNRKPAEMKENIQHYNKLWVTLFLNCMVHHCHVTSWECPKHDQTQPNSKNLILFNCLIDKWQKLNGKKNWKNCLQNVRHVSFEQKLTTWRQFFGCFLKWYYDEKHIFQSCFKT